MSYHWTWSYDGLNGLVSETLDMVDNALDFTRGYSFDLASNRVASLRTQASGQTLTTYSYDANDRLLGEVKDIAGTSVDDTITLYLRGPYTGAVQNVGLDSCSSHITRLFGGHA